MRKRQFPGLTVKIRDQCQTIRLLVELVEEIIGSSWFGVAAKLQTRCFDRTNTIAALVELAEKQSEKIAGYEAVYRDLVNRCSECPWRYKLLQALEAQP